MSAVPIEQRLTALEAEVARLKAKVEGRPTSAEKPWWKQIWGVFANDPAFLEAMRLGREYRESLGSKPQRRRKK